MIRTITPLALAAALGACAAGDSVPRVAADAAPAEAAAMSQAEAHEALFALFEQSDEDQLRRNPIMALFRGDTRYADQLGNYLTDEYYEAEKAAARTELERLQAIPRDVLGPVDRIAYDVFEYEKQQALRGLTDELIAVQVVRPINHFRGYHTFYPVLASGQGAAPFNTVKDYEDNLRRHEQFAELIDRSIARFREGLETGVVETQLTIHNVIGQLDTQLAQSPKESPYYQPALNFPDDFSEADKARLAAEYERAVSEGIFPAYSRLRNFLADEYVGNARGEVGLASMKGGDTLYRHFIENTTTLPLTPAFIHELGNEEVARITAQMDQIRQEVGYEGTLGEFFEFMRTDPQFHPESREALADRYYAIGRTVDEHIDTEFSVLPKTGLEIRPVEPFREKNAAGGSYNSGTPDGSRPGVFYFNAYNLEERPVWGMETLYLHEGAPGHHFQLSLAQENMDLPNFMRFGGNTAFVEGWALYAETLGPQLGLFDDPYQRFGHLNDEMLRAMRLVVDTGLHAKGWSRDQAIQYMLDHSGLTQTEAVSEVERYIAIPSQAVAYKIGALKIQELKRRAQEALGDRFDPREFHAQVLNTGALPLPILERKIDDWIASKHL